MDIRAYSFYWNKTVKTFLIGPCLFYNIPKICNLLYDYVLFIKEPTNNAIKGSVFLFILIFFVRVLVTVIVVVDCTYMNTLLLSVNKPLFTSKCIGSTPSIYTSRHITLYKDLLNFLSNSENNSWRTMNQSLTSAITVLGRAKIKRNVVNSFIIKNGCKKLLVRLCDEYIAKEKNEVLNDT